MVSKGDRVVVIWPEYFDASISRDKGRRVSKKYAIVGPKVEDIVKAARSLKMDYVVESDAAHPSMWWKRRGRVLIRKTARKTRIIRMLATRIKYLKDKGEGGE